MLICAQNFAIIAWLALVARRKGTGSLRGRLRPRAASAGGGVVRRRARGSSLGIGLQLVALLPIGLLESVYGDTAKQDVVKTADRASGWQIPVLALAIVLLAPLTEELLFRGTLLRSLLRKIDARMARCSSPRWSSAWSTRSATRRSAR